MDDGFPGCAHAWIVCMRALHKLAHAHTFILTREAVVLEVRCIYIQRNTYSHTLVQPQAAHNRTGHALTYTS